MVSTIKKSTDPSGENISNIELQWNVHQCDVTSTDLLNHEINSKEKVFYSLNISVVNSKYFRCNSANSASHGVEIIVLSLIGRL